MDIFGGTRGKLIQILTNHVSLQILVEPICHALFVLCLVTCYRRKIQANERAVYAGTEELPRL